MQYKRLTYILFLLLISCDNNTLVHAQVSSAAGDGISSALELALEEWVTPDFHYGVSAAIIFEDGTEWVKSAGTEKPGSSLETGHLIWIASITKTMTGAIILQLADEGRLSLEDPVSKWLPEMENINPEITIRQLLNHTNGLENYTNHQGLWTKANQDKTHVFSAQELMEYVGPPAFEPGTKTQYTNTSFVLLGLIAEAVSGKPLVNRYRKRLWEPLGLKQIFLPGHETATSPVATAWHLTRATTNTIEPLKEMSVISTGSYAFGLFANAQSVARWGKELFTGSIISEKMRAEMLEFVPAAGNIPGESGAGLGIRKYNFLGREQWGHSGGSPFGSSLIIYDPETGITVAVLMNQGARAGHFNLAPKLLKIASGSS
ncbi:MAG TPA: serine hydrolase domain-containing protein [Bacteroidales bacterium]|nr:serine hydrolase domain-containing protein [Bacteroidales bacterium]